MSSFLEPRLLPAVRKDHWTRPDEQVSHRLSVRGWSGASWPVSGSGVEQVIAVIDGTTSVNGVESKQPRRCWTHRTGPDHTPLHGRRWLS